MEVLNRIFELSGFQLSFVMIDVLHALDLGCSQDMLSNLLWIVMLRICSGRSYKDKVRNLKDKLKSHYRLFQTPCQVNDITQEMIWAEGKRSPKLRTKGAECRHIIPFGVEVALDLHEQVNDTESQSILHLLSLLLDFYMLMSEAWDADLAAKTARHVLLLYNALSKKADSDGSPLWRIKQTFRLFSELAEYCVESGMDPREFRNYRDEDFVGWGGEVTESRGGAARPVTAAKRLLDRYRALGSL